MRTGIQSCVAKLTISAEGKNKAERLLKVQTADVNKLRSYSPEGNEGNLFH